MRLPSGWRRGDVHLSRAHCRVAAMALWAEGSLGRGVASEVGARRYVASLARMQAAPMMICVRLTQVLTLRLGAKSAATLHHQRLGWAAP